MRMAAQKLVETDQVGLNCRKLNQGYGNLRRLLNSVSGLVQARRAVPRLVAACVAALLTMAAPAQAQNVQPQGLDPEVSEFVARMAREHGFDAVELGRMFGEMKPNETIIKAFNTPATARPWSYFRNLYVTEGRIDGGVAFWNANAQLLERARLTYGVPEEIIVSIIGVETIYGQYTGSFRIVDALYTLGFEVPRRSKFFRGQLEHFLLLTRVNHIDLESATGSYAGAMGLPQFMPSSYRQYAVDFDGDGRVDLWNSVADAIGSVANYLSRFGWEEGDQIVLPAKVTGTDTESLERLGVKPSLTIAQMRSRGIETDAQVADDAKVGFFSLEAEDGMEYWLSLKNFYVITRYNRSNNYAMAVYQLAQEVAKKRHEQLSAAVE
jgi:membrane-bound lytic murein transglycosylase B